VLMGDEPALAPEVTFYQRLLARDEDEALQLVDAHRRSESAEQVFDELIIPALCLAKNDRERDALTDDDEQFIMRATRGIVDDLGEKTAGKPPPESQSEAATNGRAPGPAKLRVLGCPARDEADETALEMFRQLLDPVKWDVEIAATEMLSSE